MSCYICVSIILGNNTITINISYLYTEYGIKFLLLRLVAFDVLFVGIPMCTAFCSSGFSSTVAVAGIL